MRPDFRKKLLTLSEERFCDAAGDFSAEKDDSDVCSAEEAPKIGIFASEGPRILLRSDMVLVGEEMKMDFCALYVCSIESIWSR